HGHKSGRSYPRFVLSMLLLYAAILYRKSNAVNQNCTKKRVKAIIPFPISDEAAKEAQAIVASSSATIFRVIFPIA
ncbi:MAG: hypothetical protein ACRD3S_06085, partial [Terracidiphilus sp.]